MSTEPGPSLRRGTIEEAIGKEMRRERGWKGRGKGRKGQERGLPRLYLTSGNTGLTERNGTRVGNTCKPTGTRSHRKNCRTA